MLVTIDGYRHRLVGPGYGRGEHEAGDQIGALTSGRGLHMELRARLTGPVGIRESRRVDDVRVIGGRSGDDGRDLERDGLARRDSYGRVEVGSDDVRRQSIADTHAGGIVDATVGDGNGIGDGVAPLHRCVRGATVLVMANVGLLTAAAKRKPPICVSQSPALPRNSPVYQKVASSAGSIDIVV